jgi:SpoVK/Ycf46/Vps4 family AAA+-type ATPase
MRVNYSGYIGEGESVLRAIFIEARRAGPALVFIDELQAAFSGDSSSTLTATLSSCLDDTSTWNTACGGHAVVTVIAATNEPWAIHDSFLRAGR